MSECSLSGRGQSHVSNFYTVDLENFAIASRRYTSDYQQLVRSRFVYDTYRTKRLDCVMVECTCLLNIGPL